MKLVQLRKKKGITQAELAARCETTQQTIAKIEKGLVEPKLVTLRKLSNALGCELPELFFSRNEFISQINEVIQGHKLNLKKVSVMGLNDLCAEEKHIPPFHPYWENVVISNNSVKLTKLKEE